MFFWKILEVSIFGRLVCTYCLLKDDMPFVSGSYVTEVNDYIEKPGLFFFFKKLRKMGPTNDSLALSLPELISQSCIHKSMYLQHIQQPHE